MAMLNNQRVLSILSIGGCEHRSTFCYPPKKMRKKHVRASLPHFRAEFGPWWSNQSGDLSRRSMETSTVTLEHPDQILGKSWYQNTLPRFCVSAISIIFHLFPWRNTFETQLKIFRVSQAIWLNQGWEPSQHCGIPQSLLWNGLDVLDI